MVGNVIDRLGDLGASRHDVVGTRLGTWLDLVDRLRRSGGRTSSRRGGNEIGSLVGTSLTVSRRSGGAPRQNVVGTRLGNVVGTSLTVSRQSGGAFVRTWLE